MRESAGDEPWKGRRCIQGEATRLILRYAAKAKSPAVIKRKYPHHVALPAERLPAPVNREVIFCAPASCRRRHASSLRPDDSDFVVFCFAKSKDAETLATLLVGSGCLRVGRELAGARQGVRLARWCLFLRVRWGKGWLIGGGNRQDKAAGAHQADQACRTRAR